ncbi:ATP-binding protein [Roseivivax isoporae]|uniref:histidine kinase n=1 Tax=Roseivivax isoporae LMG 25204 TaxID=1449351 RepID=X7FAL1_9RHOB|nr:ATP-binding protein [Roseivivax isoporae]ETX29136.1 histidine kinase [Roseivivax isoporae LMG 25204]
MSFQWLKRYVPRGLYGRAILILALPVVVLQLVVSVVFIQRHFEGVTEQLTGQTAQSLNAVMAQPEDSALATRLDLVPVTVDRAEVPQSDQRRWYDFSGRVVVRTLHEEVPGILRVILPTDTAATIFVADPEGEAIRRFDFHRDRLSAPNPHQLLVNMAVFGGLMTFIAYLYLRNQLRPITQLAQAAEAFGRGRHVPYSAAGAVEVRAAGNAFLDMRARIERQIEQRTLMLSGISHDLRTPLTRMKLGLSMLDDADREPLEQDVEDMRRMVDSFLDFVRGNAEAGQPEEVDVAEFLRAVVEDARRGGRTVEIGEIEGMGRATMRPMAIRRALENLIGNAVRYGTRCEVSVRLSERSLRFRVEDDGPGIAPEARDEALRPFVRLDVARNQDRGTGVGLGLAIAADIARAHGGVLRLGDSPRLGGLQADIVIAR